MRGHELKLRVLGEDRGVREKSSVHAQRLHAELRPLQEVRSWGRPVREEEQVPYEFGSRGWC